MAIKTKMKKKVKAKAAVSGARGPGYKPVVGIGGDGQFSDFLFFQLPRKAEDVPVYMLEEDWAWVIYHQYKRNPSSQYMNNDFFLAPVNPEKLDKPTFVDKWCAENDPTGDLIKNKKTAAVTTIFVPKGVPSKDGGKWYQAGERKLLLIPHKLMKQFEAHYTKGTRIGKPGLLGLKFNVSRGDDKQTARIGDVWFPDGRTKISSIAEKLKLKVENLALDWKKHFPEVTKESFQKLLKTIQSGRAVSTSDDEDDGDDIPF